MSGIKVTAHKSKGEIWAKTILKLPELKPDARFVACGIVRFNRRVVKELKGK